MEGPIPLGGMHICRPAIIRSTTTQVQGFQLMSDLHIGARHVDYALIKQELREAKENGDRVLINGDVFDMILIGDKKRFRADVLHPRLLGRVDLVDAAIQWGVELLAPYADITDMIGMGNHESSLEKYVGVDAIKILIHELKKHQKDKKHVIHYGGYCGFVDYRFNRYGSAHRLIIFYHHGSGGAAPITKGMIDFSRKSWAECDVVWMGHRHNKLSSTIQTLRCPLRGDDPVIREVRHVMSGAYFKTYAGQSQESVWEHGRITNYAADWGCAPQGCGGARLIVTVNCDNEMSVKLTH